MLKLSVSTPLVTYAVSAFTNYGLSLFDQFKTNEDINNLIKDQNEKAAKGSKTTLEDILKTQENADSIFVKTLNSLSSTYKDKLNFENKFIKTDITDEEFTLEIKEEFLTDMIDNVFICYEKLIPVFIKIIPVFKTINDIDKSFKEKWYEPKVEKETTTTVKTKVLTTAFSSNGWDFVINENNKPEGLVLKDGESTIMVDDFIALNKNSKVDFKIHTHLFKYVLNNNDSILVKYPKSLQVALKNLLTDYYKVTL